MQSLAALSSDVALVESGNLQKKRRKLRGEAGRVIMRVAGLLVKPETVARPVTLHSTPRRATRGSASDSESDSDDEYDDDEDDDEDDGFDTDSDDDVPGQVRPGASGMGTRITGRPGARCA